MPSKFLMFGGACAVALGVASGHAQAATWAASSPATSSCSATNLFAVWAYGSYSIENDVWAPCSQIAVGPQTIWANSNLDWGVWSDQPNTSNVKSYPHIGYQVNKKISALTTLTAKVAATVPSNTVGSWESAFDVWAGSGAHEIMIWLNYTGTALGCGAAKPVSYNWTAAGCAIPVYTNVTISGTTWNVYVGNNTKNMVYSFLRVSKTNHTTVDVLAFMKYLKGLNYFGDVTIGDLQYGFEITASPGGLNFSSANYVVTAK